MLQRLQTLWLLISFLLTLGCLAAPIAHFVALESMEQADMYNLWLVSEGQHVFYFCPILMAILVVSASVMFFDVWLYRRRVLQMRLVCFSMTLLAAWYVCYGIICHQLSQDISASFRPCPAAALPAAALILLWLAYRGISKDEKLVRSLDRLR